MKGGGSEVGFGFNSFIGETDNKWRDYVEVCEWRTMHHR